MGKKYQQSMYNTVLTYEEELKKRGTKFLIVVGYDGVQSRDCPSDMHDVLMNGSNRLPDQDHLEMLTDFYKPLEIRGQFRRMIWAEVYDSVGKINIPYLFDEGGIKYVATHAQM
jgi:hypothetical protein